MYELPCLHAYYNCLYFVQLTITNIYSWIFNACMVLIVFQMSNKYDLIVLFMLVFHNCAPAGTTLYLLTDGDV